MRQLERGTTGTSYGLVVGLIAIVALAATTSIGRDVTLLFEDVSGEMGDVVAETQNNTVEPTPTASPSPTGVPLASNCALQDGFAWCFTSTTSGCGGNYDTGPNTLDEICTDAGLSWGGNHVLSDNDAYAIANLMRATAGNSAQSAADGCGSNSGGNNSFSMNGGGICSRESRTQTSSDAPCSPWSSYNGTDWHVFSRCDASALAAPTPTPNLSSNCATYDGYIWCHEATDSQCSGGYNDGPISLNTVCTNAGLSWAGNHILADSDAYFVANLMRTAAGESTQTAQDGCSGSSGGNNAFAMDGGGICARQSRTQSSSDMPCSPWDDYSGTDWHVFARCQ